MKKKAIRITLLCLGCLLLLGCKYEYSTYTLEAKQVQSTADYMRAEGWKLFKKEKIGERVYEKTAKEGGGFYTPHESFYDPNYRQHTEVRDVYSVTFRRFVGFK